MFVNSSLVPHELNYKFYVPVKLHVSMPVIDYEDNDTPYLFETYMDYLGMFYKAKISSFSGFFTTYISSYYRTAKTQIKFKIKIKRRRKKKKKIRQTNTYFLFNVVFDGSSPFFSYKKKWRKVRKISISKPMKTILRSRKILKFFFGFFKTKSRVLTQKLLRVFSNKTSNSSIMFFNTLGCLLLRSNIIFSVKDAYFFLKTNSVHINNKISSSFFQIVKPGDIISFTNLIFFMNYFWYFRFSLNKWLKRKKRKNSYKLRRYVYTNKITTNINLVVRRWLLKVKAFKSRYSNFEIDYHCFLILVFSNSTKYVQKNLFWMLVKPLGLLNTWYYYF